MRKTVKYDILKTTEDGKVLCPFCRNSLRLRVTPDTEVDSLGVFCRTCHREIQITIHSGQRFYSQRPE